MPDLGIRPLTLYDLESAMAQVAEQFGSSRVVSRGVLHEARDLPGLIAVRDGANAGLLQYHLEGDGLEVVILIATERRLGTGRRLLEAVEPIARDAGCRRMWLITTNNNTDAIAFYQAIGWRQAAVHGGAVDAARRLKPEIPEHDDQGRPIRDEIEFERRLD